MFRLLIMVSLVIGCSIEEETSELASSDSARDGATIPIERADVNRDGEVNVLDLTAVSYWIGETVADWLGSNRKISVEREVKSELLKNPQIEIGKFFSMSVWARMDGGVRLARDFFTDDRMDPTCRITTEIVALNEAGEIVPDAIASFNAYPSGGDDPTPGAAVGKSAYLPASRVNGQGYGASLLMFFTASALRNNVEKLVVKSGSKCGGMYLSGQKYRSMKKRLTPAADVAQIPVTLRESADDLTVTANLDGQYGTLRLDFSRPLWTGGVGVYNPYEEENIERRKDATEQSHLAVMLVDNQGIQRGYYSSESGVAQGGRYLYPEIATTRRGADAQFDYDILGFGWRTTGGQQWRHGGAFACAEGWRVLVLVQDMHKVTRSGTFFVAKEGSTRIYEGDCRS